MHRSASAPAAVRGWTPPRLLGVLSGPIRPRPRPGAARPRAHRARYRIPLRCRLHPSTPDPRCRSARSRCASRSGPPHRSSLPPTASRHAQPCRERRARPAAGSAGGRSLPEGGSVRAARRSRSSSRSSRRRRRVARRGGGNGPRTERTAPQCARRRAECRRLTTPRWRSTCGSSGWASSCWSSLRSAARSARGARNSGS